MWFLSPRPVGLGYCRAAPSVLTKAAGGACPLLGSICVEKIMLLLLSKFRLALIAGAVQRPSRPGSGLFALFDYKLSVNHHITHAL